MDAAGTQPSPQSVPSLNSLPATVWVAILACLPNPGHAVRGVCLVSKGLHEVITQHCDGYWEEQCIKTGWSAPHEPAWTKPPTTNAGTTSSSLPSQSQPPGHQRAAQPVQWFMFYAHRMNLRRSVRRLFNLYTPFMSRASQMSLNPGASLEQLQEAEGRLGVRLPWELWELYRHHAGQEPASGALFADGARLLGLHELCVESVLLQSPSIHHQLLEDASTRMDQLQIPQHIKKQVKASVGGDPGQPPTSTSSSSSSVTQPRAIKFAESASGSLRFLVDLQAGTVLVQRGLSTHVVAPTLTRFLQKLLT